MTGAVRMSPAVTGKPAPASAAAIDARVREVVLVQGKRQRFRSQPLQRRDCPLERLPPHGQHAIECRSAPRQCRRAVDLFDQRCFAGPRRIVRMSCSSAVTCWPGLRSGRSPSRPSREPGGCSRHPRRRRSGWAWRSSSPRASAPGRPRRPARPPREPGAQQHTTATAGITWPAAVRTARTTQPGASRSTTRPVSQPDSSVQGARARVMNVGEAAASLSSVSSIGR